MASLTKAINKDLFDKILPTFGNPRVHVPVWDEGQKMFLCEEYESGNGHRYYKGVRFCDRIVIVEKVGLYHTWTYIDGIEVYAFNGTERVLIGKVDYNKAFYNADQIKMDTKAIIANYLEDSARIDGSLMDSTRAKQQANELLEKMYENPMRSAMALKGVYQQLLLAE
jgi:hypothetical protein